jgi:hypothetical protein
VLKPPKPAFADFAPDLRQGGRDGGVGPGRSPRSGELAVVGFGPQGVRPAGRAPTGVGGVRPVGDPGGILPRSFREAGRKLAGSWPEPGRNLAGTLREAGGKLAGSWREAGGKLAGSWRDGSRTVRGRFENDSRASGRRKRRQAKPATPAMARSLRRGERARRGRWPDPGGMVRGQFENDSRTIRGRRGGGSAVRPSPRAPLRRPRFDAITRPGCCDWAITTSAIRPAAA